MCYDIALVSGVGIQFLLTVEQKEVSIGGFCLGHIRNNFLPIKVTETFSSSGERGMETSVT